MVLETINIWVFYGILDVNKFGTIKLSLQVKNLCSVHVFSIEFSATCIAQSIKSILHVKYAPNIQTDHIPVYIHIHVGNVWSIQD